MYRWFGFLGLSHQHCLSLNHLLKWNRPLLPKLEESNHHPVKRVILHSRREYHHHGSGLVQEALLLFPFLDNFSQNDLVFCIQNRSLSFFIGEDSVRELACGSR